MLISSIGFSLEVHYCGEEVENFGFFGAAECEMAVLSISSEEFAALPPCHQAKLNDENKKCVENQHKKEGYNSNSCCHNTSYDYSAQNTGKINATQLLTNHHSFLPPIRKEMFVFGQFEKIQTAPNLSYHPPTCTWNRCVKLQVFRI